MGSLRTRESGQAPTGHTGESSVEMTRFSWQQLPQLERFIQDYEWPQQQIPDILTSLPDHVVVNQKLRDILEWSLKRYQPKPPEPDVEVRPNESESSSSFDEQLEIQFEPPPIPEQISSIPQDVPAPIPIQRAMSKKTRPLFFRLRHLRQDIASKIASTKTHPQTKLPTPPIEEVVGQMDDVNIAELMIEQVPANGECISCFDEFPSTELVHLECSHDYCKGCLREVINNAMKTESAFPPKCCLSEIPLKTILVCLDKTQREAYQEKAAEYAIPAGHRWYCPEPKCAKWIKPDKLHKNRRSHQTCPHCKVKICSICRSIAHDGNAECPQDFGLNSTLEVAEAEGWRRCYSCRTMVELTTGCRHITCQCGAEFCYVCNARWRTCNCTETDKIRRLAELRTQREERERLERERDLEQARRQQEDAEAAEVAEAEAREIAEAIAQIEEMERQDAIRRAEEDERRQLEEQLALARLEEERLLQEIARREAEEEAERQLRLILIQSSKEECQAMAQTLVQIIEYQHITLMSQHAQKGEECLRQREYGQETLLAEIRKHKAWLDHNIELRRKTLQAKHDKVYAALAQEAEEEEDDLFMQMHMHLRNKPNREQREKKMRDALLMQQKMKREEVDERHAKDIEQFEKMLHYETEALQKSNEFKMQHVNPRRDDELWKVGRTIGCDRKYFEIISQRRQAMVAAHEQQLLQQLDAEDEPTGFEEDDVHGIEPILPSIDLYDGANAPEVTPLTTSMPAFPHPHSTMPEDDDMYGSSNRRSYMDSELGRSETVTRTIPGAYPRSTSTPMHSYDQPTAPRYYANQVAQPIQAPTIQIPQQQQNYEHVSRHSMNNTEPRNIEVAITPPETDYASSQAMTSDSRDSASFDDNQGSQRTSISTKASSNREWLDKKQDQGRRRSSIFNFKKKELTEEELKRRYLQAAGDSFGR